MQAYLKYWVLAMEASNWMERLPPEKHLYALKDVILPGSHDSGVFKLRKDLEVAVDQPALRAGGLFEGAVKSLLYNWSKTQSLNIYEQLAAGIRYLDFRAAIRDEDSKFYLLHRLYGAELSESLEDVKRFALKHPKEVIIIHFQHFYNMATEAHEKLVGKLYSTLGDLLYPPGEKAVNATLQEIWQSGKNIVVLYRYDDIACLYSFLWPVRMIKNPWANTDDEVALIDFLDKQCCSFAQDCLHVTQAILSPQPSTLEKNLSGSLEKDLALKCNEHVCKWLNGLCSIPGKHHKFNIIMADFVEHGQFIDTVIEMNYLYWMIIVLCCIEWANFSPDIFVQRIWNSPFPSNKSPAFDHHSRSLVVWLTFIPCPQFPQV